MSEHVISSPTHGELHVVLEQHPADQYGRTWTAQLDPRPPKLRHLLGCSAGTGEAALELMTATVEQYDATSVVPRRPAWDTQRS